MTRRETPLYPRAITIIRDTYGHPIHTVLGVSEMALAVERAVEDGVNLANANLRNCDFICRNLSGAKLQGADLRDCKFHMALLTGANLQNSNCEWASFDFADCRETRFDGARFTSVRFAGANLAGSSFGFCNFGHVCNDFLDLLQPWYQASQRLLFDLLDAGQFEGLAPCFNQHGRLTTVMGVKQPTKLPHMPPTEDRLSEVFATGIGLGDTPANNPLCRLLCEWLRYRTAEVPQLAPRLQVRVNC